MPERNNLIISLLLIITLVAMPASAVSSVTGILPVPGPATGGDPVIVPGNASQPQASGAVPVSPTPVLTPAVGPMAGPQPTTTALAPVVEYSKGYPIPVPVLFFIGITIVAAAGLFARRRSIHP